MAVRFDLLSRRAFDLGEHSGLAIEGCLESDALFTVELQPEGQEGNFKLQTGAKQGQS
jgi:hypothetical protein